MKTDFFKLAASIGICLMAGFAGSYFTVQSIPTWYAALQKPWFSPPNWIFGPVWTLLYILMGAALYLVWAQKKTKKRDFALGVFAFQLALNFLWSLAFFGARSPLLGIAVILPLWASIAASIWLFWGISRKSSALMAPYLAWVSFATILNFSIWLLNP